jgi:hypothetical protein
MRSLVWNSCCAGEVMTEFLIIVKRDYLNNGTHHDARVVQASDAANAVFVSGFSATDVIRVERVS